MKPRAQTSFDNILKEFFIPINTLYPPGRVSKSNNNTYMISYAAMLTKDTTPYDLKNLPPKASLKRNLTLSYDNNTTNDFPNISNTHTHTQNQTKNKYTNT